MYIGHTENTMSERYSKHKYDIKNRPSNCDLAKHCHRDHDLEKDIEVSIIDHGIQDLDERRRAEDKYICRLQTFGTGINTELGPYAREMYECWKSTTSYSTRRQ